MLAAAAAPLASVAGPSDPVWSPLAERGHALDGVWDNPATGHALRITATGLELFHRLDDLWISDPGLSPPFSLFARDGDTLRLQTYDYRATPWLMQAPALLSRTLSVPPAAPLAQTDTIAPSAVFDLICRSFGRHYAFFAERGVDWTTARRDAVRNPPEDNDAVFDRLAQMLAPLNDGHVNLSRGDRTFNAGRPRLRQRLTQAWERRPGAGQDSETEGAFVSRWSRESRASVTAALDPGTHRSGANDALEWGRIGPAGYLRIHRFSGFLPGQASRPEQVAELGRALAEAEQAFAGSSRVIVDVAHNGGGNDAAAMAVARHFADRDRRVLTYAVRGMADQPIRLGPAGAPYSRPVLLLTSEITASAAEVFVTLMRAFPGVTQVGGTTRGMLSSLLPKPFPNGFQATMAYQRVLDADGGLHEARGLEPARPIELFPDADLWGGYRRAVEALARDG